MNLVSYGRIKIYTNEKVITADNIRDVLHKAYYEHQMNRSAIVKLWDYYRGKTAILRKTKEIRASINHKVCENRAYEIVNFHKGYTFGEPIQYIRRENTQHAETADDALASAINTLNGYMADADKAACDNELAEWLYVCGTSYRLTLPNKQWSEDSDEPPFNVYSLDPRNTFVVYHAGVAKKPVMGVSYVTRDDNTIVYSVYTENEYYEVTDQDVILKREAHALGAIPIIEYPADNARLGVFEPVITLLNALDELQSNRLDDIEQTVNSFLAIFGAELDDETYEKLNDWKTLCMPSGTDAKYLSVSLNQAEVQTLKADILQAIVEICSMPNRNGGSSTSDTGTAVHLRDGWAAAETKAKATELTFKKSEKMFLKLVLRILRDTVGTALRLTDIETHFTRRNYENIAAKSQVLIAMLNNPKIHPELAFAHCGMFADSESAYLQSKAWWEEQEKREQAEMDTYVKSLSHKDEDEDE